MSAMIYDRKTGAVTFGSSFPGGSTWGQISLRRLCETLEMCGEAKPGQRVTHLVIEDGTISYRVEPRGGKS